MSYMPLHGFDAPPHPPGLGHPFDPANCASDAMWHQRQLSEAAAIFHSQKMQIEASVEITRQETLAVANRQRRLLLLRG